MEPKTNPREEDQNRSLCNRNGIKVLPEPVAGRYRLTVMDNGKPKYSKNTYPEKTTNNEIGAWDKLHQLYAHIATKIKNQE